jgi:hypothetical protein
LLPLVLALPLVDDDRLLPVSPLFDDADPLVDID